MRVVECQISSYPPQLFCYFLTLCTALFQRRVTSRNVVLCCSACSDESPSARGAGERGVINCFLCFHYLIPPPPCSFSISQCCRQDFFQPLFQWSDCQIALFVGSVQEAKFLLVLCCKTECMLRMLLRCSTVKGENDIFVRLNFLRPYGYLS